MADEKEPLYGKQTDCANRCFNGANCIKALFFGIRKGELIILTQLDLLYWIILDNSQNNTSANIDVKHLLTYIRSYESVVSHMKALIIGVYLCQHAILVYCDCACKYSILVTIK